MKRMPTIKSVMTPFPYTIEIEDHLAAAQEMMTAHGIHHLPVSDDGRLVGVISEHEIETALVAEPSIDPASRGVRSCYNPHIYVVGLTAPLDAVLVEMVNKHVRSVLVVKGDKLAGIFTVTDACRHYSELLQSLYPPTPEDHPSNGDDDQAA